MVFEELQELFLQAVSLSTNPTDIDSDLQVKENLTQKDRSFSNI